MRVIELSDVQEAALTAKAARHGLTLDTWIKKLADEETDNERDLSDPYPLQTAANIVLNAMRETPVPFWKSFTNEVHALPDDVFNRLPPDGASEHDHYLYGSPKRNS
jgi:hypothetical protein